MSERDRSIEEGIAAFRKTEEANLRKCGWVKRHVFPTTKQPGIDFSYTIGLTEKFGAPELIMTGLGEAADHIINHAVRLMERSEEHTSELQSLMPTSYAVFCLKKKLHKQEVKTKTQQYSV